MPNLATCSTLSDGNAYARGLADGRRTVEAEVAAERAAVATLAVSLAEALDALQLISKIDPPADFLHG